ncbi:MAG TPA: BatA domain-containing protein [Vicinamibacterales bacterium]|nr:BatA domain-containing protein [Vicinamibacterales bacterium]
MIAFANPWAWFGAMALALPIAVHLLRRHRATRRPFPTLRFLPDARVVAVRRHRPTDVPLMFIRLAVVAAAVVALAQPVWRNASAVRAAGPGLSRAVIVDRSPRMSQPSDDGRPGVDRAAAEISRLSSATNQIVVDAADIRQGLAAAIGWANRQTGDREVVVVSSFAAGSLSATDAAAVPSGVGLKLIQIPLNLNAQPAGLALDGQSAAGESRTMTPRLTLTPAETAVSWVTGPAAPSAPIDWRARPEDAAGLRAAAGAAFEVGVPTRAADRPVVVVLPGAPDRASLSTSAHAIDTPWMFDAVRALSEDRLLASVARTATAVTADAPAVFTPIVADERGATLLAAARTDSNPAQLLLFSNAAAPTLFTAALSTAIAGATRAGTWSALEPTSISRDELTRWERPTGSTGPSAPAVEGAPLGRWLWVAALVLLGLEWWWRRRPEPAATSSMGDRRVA